MSTETKKDDKQKKPKSGFKMPHIYVLLIMVMFIVVVLSWVVPSGEFEKIQDPETGREIINPDNYNRIEDPDGISFMDFFVAIHDGVVQSGDIIIMLLFAVGAIYLVEQTGAIGAGIQKLLEISAGKELLVIGVLTLIFSVLGAIGLGEGGIPFIPLSITIVMGMGYDRITGMATAMGGLAIGFASGVLNLFTTGIGQNIVGLPLFSGISYRIFGLFVFYIITVIYIISYARKIKKDPEKSITRKEYLSQINNKVEEKEEKLLLTKRRILSLLGLLTVFIMQAYGAIELGWNLGNISAIYLMLAFFVALINKTTPSQAAVNFAKGANRVLPAALAIGIARSIMLLMDQAKIIDTAIYGLSQLLDGRSPVIILLLVYLAIIIFNFFVISGSGKAVILMPILGPLAQLVNINQQIMVLAFNYGDGLTNYIWPTSGGLMAGLGLGKVEWNEWARFSAKLFTILTIVGFLLVIGAYAINLGPF